MRWNHRLVEFAISRVCESPVPGETGFVVDVCEDDDGSGWLSLEDCYSTREAYEAESRGTPDQEGSK